MRALQFLGAGQSQLIDVPVPKPRPGWAVVKVHYCCLCGSDLWLFRGKWHGNRYPVVPGHEWSGVVAAVGEGGDQALVGTPVAGDLIWECRTCGPCRDGLPVMCENMTEIGFTDDGACAGHVEIPIPNLYALPAGLDLAAASQVEPLAVAVHAVDRVGVRPGDRVAVLGTGGIGLLLIQAARAAGGTVVLATDLVPERRAAAEQLGAGRAVDPTQLTDPVGWAEKVDVVLEASGDPSSVRRSLDLIRPGGRVGLIGYQVGAEHPFETALLPLGYASLLGVMGPGGKFRQAIDLLASGAVDVGPILTDVVRLDDAAASIERAIGRKDGTIRVVFDLRDE